MYHQAVSAVVQRVVTSIPIPRADGGMIFLASLPEGVAGVFSNAGIDDPELRSYAWLCHARKVIIREEKSGRLPSGATVHAKAISLFGKDWRDDVVPDWAQREAATLRRFRGSQNLLLGEQAQGALATYLASRVMSVFFPDEPDRNQVLERAPGAVYVAWYMKASHRRFREKVLEIVRGEGFHPLTLPIFEEAIPDSIFRGGLKDAELSERLLVAGA